MKENQISTIEAFKEAGTKTIVAAILCILITAAVIMAGFSYLYGYSKQAINLQGEMNAKQSAEEFDKQLLANENVIILAAYTVNNMMGKDQPNKKILDYMLEESGRIKNTIDEDYTGLYGWINEEYLDGGGWVPDPGYNPKERPWYIETMEQKQEINFVTPYVDMQTHNVMMTITEILDDGESIIALDIDLLPLQQITEEITAAGKETIQMVLDENGGVVAHSDPDMRGKSLLQEPDTLDGKIAEKVFKDGETQFVVKSDDHSYVVYAEAINGGWYSVSAVGRDEMFRPLRLITAASILLLILMIAIILIAFSRVSKRHLIMRKLNRQLAAMADIYESSYDIDMRNNTFVEIRTREDIGKAVGGAVGNAQETLKSAMDKLTADSSKESIQKFVDLSTLEERLGDNDTITEEFLDYRNIWCRGRFIAADKDDKGKIGHVIWAVESIDKEKRRRDQLVQLSETDLMTGVNNRGSGEAQIRRLMEEGRRGMFFMLDVDAFKAINDSFGHRVGDKVLIAIADCLKGTFRSEDVVMRLGGDEFAAYAPGIYNPADAEHLVDRLMKNLRNIKIEEMNGLDISVSCGASFCVPDDGQDFESLYQKADARTYDSKLYKDNYVTYDSPSGRQPAKDGDAGETGDTGQ